MPTFWALRKRMHFNSTCKKCAEGHKSNACTSIKNSGTCHNCVIVNRRGFTYNVRHGVTDERCPCRKERIEALKKLLLSKN